MEHAELDGVRRIIPEVAEVAYVATKPDVIRKEAHDAYAAVQAEIVVVN